MYEANPHLDSPLDTDATWRYLDFTKLVSMLDSRCLYFTAIDRLQDKFEGAYTNKVLQIGIHSDGPEATERAHRELDQSFRNIAKFHRKVIFVNCWHLNNHESAAMWQLYLKSNEGVAIVSTFERLKSSLAKASQSILLGKVRYYPGTKLDQSSSTGAAY